LDKQAGWIVGGNIGIDYHWPGTSLDRLRAAAKEVADTCPDLVLPRSTPATAQLVNTNLPVVFVLGRSDRFGFYPELCKTRRKPDWLHKFRTLSWREVAGVIEGGRTCDDRIALDHADATRFGEPFRTICDLGLMGAAAQERLPVSVGFSAAPRLQLKHLG